MNSLLMRYAFPKLGQEAAVDSSFIPYPPPVKCPDLDSPAISIYSRKTEYWNIRRWLAGTFDGG